MMMVMMMIVVNSPCGMFGDVCRSHSAMVSLSQVYFQFGGAGERPGVVDQPDLLQSDVSTWPSSLSSSSSSSSSVPLTGSRSVSSCIDVPRRSDVLCLLLFLNVSPPVHSDWTVTCCLPLQPEESGGGGHGRDDGSDGSQQFVLQSSSSQPCNYRAHRYSSNSTVSVTCLLEVVVVNSVFVSQLL